MSVRLFICLILIAKVIPNDSTTSQREYSSDNLIRGHHHHYDHHHHEKPRIMVTDTVNDDPGNGMQNVDIRGSEKNSTKNNATVIPLDKEVKNGTVTKKEDKNEKVTNKEDKNETTTKKEDKNEATTKKEDRNETVTKKPDENEEGMQTQTSQKVYSYPPYGSYEITENVVDVPDDRTLAGPIVPGYTVSPTLNLGNPNLTSSTQNPDLEKTDPAVEKPNKTEVEKVTESNVKSKKTTFSFVHITAEFEKEKETENKVVGFFKGVKDYLHSFQKSVVSAFNGLFHKHQDPSAYEKSEGTRREGKDCDWE